jgi:hypothetical protein
MDQTNQRWSLGEYLGAGIQSSIDFRRKWLIFNSERGFPTERHTKPLTTKSENRIRGTLNGLGNIYRIDINSILQLTRPSSP